MKNTKDCVISAPPSLVSSRVPFIAQAFGWDIYGSAILSARGLDINGHLRDTRTSTMKVIREEYNGLQK